MGVTLGISQRKTDICYANVWILFSAVDLIQRSHFSRLFKAILKDRPQALKPEGYWIKFPMFLLPSPMSSLKLPIVHESHLSSSLNGNNTTCLARCLSWLNEVAYVKMFTLDCLSNINCLSTFLFHLWSMLLNNNLKDFLEFRNQCAQPYDQKKKKVSCTLVGLPWWCSGQESAFQCRKCRFSPRVGKILWRKKGQPTPVFLPEKSHGQRSLVG